VAAAGGDTVQIALVEYRLNPDRVTARAGTVIVLVRNYGRLTHNLVISSDGHPDGAIRPLPPGGWGQATVALGPGTYQLSSTVQSDQALGLSGTLIVTR
jgi:plastocyanin